MTKLDIGGLSDRGSRANNEDHWSGPPPDLPPEQVTAKGLLFLVCDGMGGHQAGEVASHMAVQIVQEMYYGDPNTDAGTSLRGAIEEANRRIYHDAISDSGRYGMGTTLIAVVLRGNEITVASVGDSRAYLIRNGQIVQLTQDHTWVAERERAGVLTEEEARSHPQRNVVTRSLGNQLEVTVDVFPPQPVYQGDTLLLCTDGLNEVVTDAEMAGIVGRGAGAADAANQLVQLTKSRGAPDNVTCLVMNAGRPARAAAGAGTRWLIPVVAGVMVGLLALVALFVVLPHGASDPARPLPTASETALAGTVPPASGESAEEEELTSEVTEPEAAATAGEPTRESDGIGSTVTHRPGLVEPSSDQQSMWGSGEVTFKWKWQEQLGEDDWFEVAVRDEDGNLHSTDKDLKTRKYEYALYLPPGKYNWLVKVVKVPAKGDSITVTQSEWSGFEVLGMPSPTPVPVSPIPEASPSSPVVSGTQTSELSVPILVVEQKDKTARMGDQTTFEWRWEGVLKPHWGFEVVVWRDGDLPAGAADAKEISREEHGGIYEASIDPAGAESVIGHGPGEYLWSVWVVHLDPYYPLNEFHELDTGKLQVGEKPGGEDEDEGGPSDRH